MRSCNAHNIHTTICVPCQPHREPIGILKFRNHLCVACARPYNVMFSNTLTLTLILFVAVVLCRIYIMYIFFFLLNVITCSALLLFSARARVCVRASERKCAYLCLCAVAVVGVFSLSIRSRRECKFSLATSSCCQLCDSVQQTLSVYNTRIVFRQHIIYTYNSFLLLFSTSSSLLLFVIWRRRFNTLYASVNFQRFNFCYFYPSRFDGQILSVSYAFSFSRIHTNNSEACAIRIPPEKIEISALLCENALCEMALAANSCGRQQQNQKQE